MIGLQGLIVDANWPDDDKTRREARRILLYVAIGYVLTITGACLLGFALASGGH